MSAEVAARNTLRSHARAAGRLPRGVLTARGVIFPNGHEKAQKEERAARGGSECRVRNFTPKPPRLGGQNHGSRSRAHTPARAMRQNPPFACISASPRHVASGGCPRWNRPAPRTVFLKPTSCSAQRRGRNFTPAVSWPNAAPPGVCRAWAPGREHALVSCRRGRAAQRPTQGRTAQKVLAARSAAIPERQSRFPSRKLPGAATLPAQARSFTQKLP